jgi:hypothetical protein
MDVLVSVIFSSSSALRGEGEGGEREWAKCEIVLGYATVSEAYAMVEGKGEGGQEFKGAKWWGFSLLTALCSLQHSSPSLSFSIFLHQSLALTVIQLMQYGDQP